MTFSLGDRVEFLHVVCGRIRRTEGVVVRVLNPGEIPADVLRNEFMEHRIAHNSWRPVPDRRCIVMSDNNVLYLPMPGSMEVRGRTYESVRR